MIKWHHSYTLPFLSHYFLVAESIAAPCMHRAIHVSQQFHTKFLLLFLYISLSLYSSKRICIFVLLVKSNKKAYEYLKHTILFPHSVSIPKYSAIEYKCKCNFDYVQNFPFLFQFKRLSLHNRNAKTHTHKQRKYGWNARAHLIYFKIQIQKKNN